MIALAALTFDPLGHVILDEERNSDLGDVSRRVNRVPTLDGGAVTNDFGSSASDRTMRVRWRVRNEAELRSVQRMVRFHQSLIVSSREGLFRAAPASVSERSGEGTIELLILEEIA
jgi:hypothetical protein